MLRPTLLLTLLTLVLSAPAQSPESTESKDEAAIRKGMADQAAAWNRGSLDDFMQTYWDNDSLMFIGQSGITYGYAPTLAHYKATYSDAEKMGKLFFSLLEVKRLSGNHYFVIGKWLLKRKAGDVGGIFSLLFRKIGGRWLIVADHTS
jgi:ketosteroid isomerase-like protein